MIKNIVFKLLIMYHILKIIKLMEYIHHNKDINLNITQEKYINLYLIIKRMII